MLDRISMKRFILAFLFGIILSFAAIPVLGTESPVETDVPFEAFGTDFLVDPDYPIANILPPIPVPEFPAPEIEPAAVTSPAQGSSRPTFITPTQGTITSNYGWRWGRMHEGVDIGAPIGTPVLASAGGWIEFSGWSNGGYGNMVDIRHFNGSVTRYAHHSRNLVSEGMHVEQGQQIAEIGSTGRSTGPHLHFEIRLPGRGPVNPVVFLPQSQVAALRR